MKMRVITMMDLRKGPGEVFNQIKYFDREFVLTKSDKPIAAIISIEEYTKLTHYRQHEQLSRDKKDPVHNITSTKKILINGKGFDIQEQFITYEEVCLLDKKNPKNRPMMNWRKQIDAHTNKAGIMYPEEQVEVLNGMFINCTYMNVS